MFYQFAKSADNRETLENVRNMEYIQLKALQICSNGVWPGGNYKWITYGGAAPPHNLILSPSMFGTVVYNQHYIKHFYTHRLMPTKLPTSTI
jgi:hypothetical protein